MGDRDGLCAAVEEFSSFESVTVKCEEMRQMASTAASSPWSRNTSPLMSAGAAAAVTQDKLLWRVLCEVNMCRDVNRDIIEILTGSKFESEECRAMVATKRQLAESDQDSSSSDLGRRRSSTAQMRAAEKRPYGAAVVVSGSCQHCGTETTPQWRYVHREKFCNACYMRIKRWVHSHLSARKLPSRARMDVSEEDDLHFTQQAREIVQLALESLGSPH